MPYREVEDFISDLHQRYALWYIDLALRYPWLPGASHLQWVHATLSQPYRVDKLAEEASNIELSALALAWQFGTSDVKIVQSIVRNGRLEPQPHQPRDSILRTALSEPALASGTQYSISLASVVGTHAKLVLPNVRRDRSLDGILDRIEFHIQRDDPDHITVAAYCFLSRNVRDEGVDLLTRSYQDDARFTYWLPWKLSRRISFRPGWLVRKDSLASWLELLSTRIERVIKHVVNAPLPRPTLTLPIYQLATKDESRQGLRLLVSAFDALSVDLRHDVFDNGSLVLSSANPTELRPRPGFAIIRHSIDDERFSRESIDLYEARPVISAALILHAADEARRANQTMFERLQFFARTRPKLAALASLAVEAARTALSLRRTVDSTIQDSWRIRELESFRSIRVVDIPGIDEARTFYAVVAGSLRSEAMRLCADATQLSQTLQDVLVAHNTDKSFALQRRILFCTVVAIAVSLLGVAVTALGSPDLRHAVLHVPLLQVPRHQ